VRAEHRVVHTIKGFPFCSGTVVDLCAETTAAFGDGKINISTSVLPAQGSFIDNRGDNMNMGTVAYQVAIPPCRSCSQYRVSCPGLSPSDVSLKYNPEHPNRGAQASFTVNVKDSFVPSEAKCLALPTSS
jgi:hypothetical protein